MSELLVRNMSSEVYDMAEMAKFHFSSVVTTAQEGLSDVGHILCMVSVMRIGQGPRLTEGS